MNIILNIDGTEYKHFGIVIADEYVVLMPIAKSKFVTDFYITENTFIYDTDNNFRKIGLIEVSSDTLVLHAE